MPSWPPATKKPETDDKYPPAPLPRAVVMLATVRHELLVRLKISAVTKKPCWTPAKPPATIIVPLNKPLCCKTSPTMNARGVLMGANVEKIPAHEKKLRQVAVTGCGVNKIVELK